MTFIPAVDDGWAILAQPPGIRDLVLPEHWDLSLGRSQRRRTARRSRVATFGVQRFGAALAAVAVTSSAAVALDAEPAAAAVGMLHKGDRGSDVAALQAKLGVPADGVFGPQTRRAVVRFQRNQGLEVDGVVGPITARALGLSSTTARSTESVEQGAPAPSAVSLSRGATMALQSALGVTADGAVGPMTRRAIRAAERSNGLPVDGKPDADLLAALGVSADAPAPTSGSGSTEAGSAAPVAASGVAAAVAAAQGAIGVPYASAGTTKAGFDCSGLTVWAFKQAGISLPRTSYDQYGVGSAVSRSSIAPGDLVFFDTAGGGASHVGVATSATTVISATTHGVMEHSFMGGYWGSHYVGARRVT